MNPPPLAGEIRIPNHKAVFKLITIIDDDNDDIYLLQSAIEEVSPSVKCTVFTSPQEALKSLSTGEFRPDVIFLDYNMPMFNGVECLQLFRTLRLLRFTSYVGSSSHMSPELEQAFLKLGASHVFEKPTSVKDYKKVVEHIFNNVLSEASSN